MNSPPKIHVSFDSKRNEDYTEISITQQLEYYLTLIIYKLIIMIKL